MEATLSTRSERNLAAAQARGTTVRPEPAQVYDAAAAGTSVPPPHMKLRRSLRDSR